MFTGLKRNRHIIILLLLCWTGVYQGTAQRWGYVDGFEDGSLSFTRRSGQNERPPYLLWRTVTPGTYQLSESEGVLQIDYMKQEGVGAYDKFSFKPFRSIRVGANPRIQMRVRSDVNTTLTVSPTYSLEPPTCEYLVQNIPGDNQWRRLTFELTREYWEPYGRAEAVDFYLDRDSSLSTSGHVEMDDFKMAWYLISVNELEATLSDGKNITLSWATSDPERTGKYLIYRSMVHGFEIGESTFLAESDTTLYVDGDLEPYQHYFYRVVPVHTSGEVFFGSQEVSGETFIPGTAPVISITLTNAQTIGKYEKFEVWYEMENVGIENPFDPDDIDVYAIFKAPSGRKIRINGFYDNHLNADQWKLRFSPDETGTYVYRFYVKDVGGSGQSSELTFKSVESGHHGWIRPSPVNPHYFTHDDGTSWYGVGVYSPWRNTKEMFDNYAEHKANLFAIWDITYGGFVNGTGLIEEELGRYNQLKVGRIDSMLSILEERNILLMYAIWPHDLFSETIWAAEWANNPYSQIIDVDEVYSDPEVWEYQQKKYRYMIARFAHSRSFGIWELINEMNGTDGWAHGRHQECYDWVEKCQRYFQENDPYNHPVTASFSGGFGEYRETLYELIDIPNIHIYPAQEWPMQHPQDTLRSAMYNYAWASRRFWDHFDKPAIFGEAGAGLAYYPVRSEEYHVSYHNQIWASLANGLAATPVWWDYPVLTEGDWDQLKILAGFVKGIDFANRPYAPVKAFAKGADLYVMGTGNEAFGWGRSFESDDISGSEFRISGLSAKNYAVEWIDPWNGEVVKKAVTTSNNGVLILKVPRMKTARADVALKIREQ